MNEGVGRKWFGEFSRKFTGLNRTCFDNGNRKALQCTGEPLKSIRVMGTEVNSNMRVLRRSTLGQSGDVGQLQNPRAMFLENLGYGFVAHVVLFIVPQWLETV